MSQSINPTRDSFGTSIAAAARRLHRRVYGPAGIWGLTGLLCAIDIALITVVLPRHIIDSSGRSLPWLVLVGAFALTEALPVHLDIRRDTVSLSLMEIPMVLGLFLAGPWHLVAARVIGDALALAVYRRQKLMKLCFNIASFSLETTVAIAVFRLLAVSGDPTNPRNWLAAALATTAAGAASTISVAAVITLNGGNARANINRRLLVSTGVVSVINTSLALSATMLLVARPAAVLLLGGVAAVLVFTYRAHASLQQRYTRLQLLYDFTKHLQQAPPDERFVELLLGDARKLMRSEAAALVLSGDDTDSAMHSVTVLSGTGPPSSEIIDGPPSSMYAQALREGAVLIASDSNDEQQLTWIRTRGWRDALLVRLTAAGKDLGMLAVGTREGDVSTFDTEDLRLFAALGNHAAIALDNRHLVDQLKHQALHDELTAMPNRRRLGIALSEALASRQHGSGLAVLLLDLDRFREINDTLGHQLGDKLLVQVGRRLSEQLPPGSFIARLGGDEFALVVGLGEKVDALSIARSINSRLERAFDLDGIPVVVGASIGIVLAPEHGEDAVVLLQRAEVAMYAAKGGQGISIYESDRDQNSARRLTLACGLRQAIADGDIKVFFQPQADIASGRIIGAEALVRWSHDDLGTVYPDEFIPLAEQTGLIRPMTLHVLDETLTELNRLRRAGHYLKMSVNLSARSLIDAEIVREVADALARHKVDAGALVLEITESSLMEDPTTAIKVLERLHDLGIELSVDDFGTGYSSLAYLKQFPVREVKIDKSFVMSMATDPRDEAIVGAIIALAHHLGLIVVAEGVETALLWDELLRLGCDIAQGYHLGRAMSSEQLLVLVTERNAFVPATAVLAR